MKDDVDVPGTDTSFLSAHQTSQIDHLLNGGQMTGQKLDVPLSPPQVASLAFTAKEATGDDFLNAHHGVVRPQACQRTGRRQILRQPPLPCRPRAAAPPFLRRDPSRRRPRAMCAVAISPSGRGPSALSASASTTAPPSGPARGRPRRSRWPCFGQTSIGAHHSAAHLSKHPLLEQQQPKQQQR